MTIQLSASDVERIAALDATDQAALVRSGELTAADLVSSAMGRIEQANPALNAVITTAFEQALDSVADGAPPGPFGGVPFLLKDLVAEAAGLRYTAGSEFLRDHESTVDSELVVRLRRAGLVVLGKASTSEFGSLSTTEPARLGATHNPWQPGHTPGGSSGGSAAAVASGMVPMAHANDVGGSIRVPASCCGLFGLKPTRGRNPLGPVYRDAFAGLGVEHAVTRSVRDSAALLDATAGPRLGDPYAAVAPAGGLSVGGFAAEVGRPPGRLRVAVTTVTPEGRPVHPECVAAAHDAAALCAELGHEVVERDMTELTPDVGAAIGTVFSAGTAWTVAHWAHRLGRAPQDGELEPFTRLLYDHGRKIGAADYLLAVTTVQMFGRRIAEAFESFDVWLSPTLAQPPLPLGVMVSGAEAPFAAQEAAAGFSAFPLVAANITGGPAMSVPLHWTASGLPVGVHVTAPVGHEATLFQLAGQLEEARPWAERRPTVWTGVRP